MKIVRKDLTKHIKEGANVPIYVLEYLLGQYCNSDDEAIIERGDWAPEHEKMGKGTTLTDDEAKALVATLARCDSTDNPTNSKVEANADEPKEEISIQNLVDHWNDVVGRAPESIREYLMPSHLNEMNPDAVTVGLKRVLRLWRFRPLKTRRV